MTCPLNHQPHNATSPASSALLSPCCLFSSHNGLLIICGTFQACICFGTSVSGVPSAWKTLSLPRYSHGSLLHLFCSPSLLLWGLLSEAFPIQPIKNDIPPQNTLCSFPVNFPCSMCYSRTYFIFGHPRPHSCKSYSSFKTLQEITDKTIILIVHMLLHSSDIE